MCVLGTTTSSPCWVLETIMIGFDLLFFGNHNHLFSLWVFGSYHQIQVCVFGNLRSTISGFHCCRFLRTTSYSRCGFCRRWLQSLAQSTTTMLSSSYLTLQNGSVLTWMWKSKVVDLDSRKWKLFKGLDRAIWYVCQIGYVLECWVEGHLCFCVAV